MYPYRLHVSPRRKSLQRLTARLNRDPQALLARRLQSTPAKSDTGNRVRRAYLVTGEQRGSSWSGPCDSLRLRWDAWNFGFRLTVTGEQRKGRPASKHHRSRFTEMARHGAGGDHSPPALCVLHPPSRDAPCIVRAPRIVHSSPPATPRPAAAYTAFRDPPRNPSRLLGARPPGRHAELRPAGPRAAPGAGTVRAPRRGGLAARGARVASSGVRRGGAHPA